MTNKQAIELLKWFGEYNDIDYCGGDMIENDKGDRFYRVVEEDLEAFDMAIKALSQQTEDAISREQALKLFATHDGHYLYEAIRDLPSVTPKQRTGHWIKNGKTDENGNAPYMCSECTHGDEHAETQIVPFCWWCGAKMEG